MDGASARDANLDGGGSDRLRGGKNDDRFVSGAGRDECAGGNGNDKDMSQPACEDLSNVP